MADSNPPASKSSTPPAIPRPAERERLRKVFHSALNKLEGTIEDRSDAAAGLLECVVGDPGNLLFLEAFLRLIRGVSPERGWWSGFWRGKPPFDRLAAEGEWGRIWSEGYAYLLRRPRDVAAIGALAAAAEAGTWEEIELCLLRYADETPPGDSHLLARLARALVRRGELESAGEIWERSAADPQYAAAAERFQAAWRSARVEAPEGDAAPDLVFPTFAKDVAEIVGRYAADLASARFADAERALHETAMRSGERRWAEERRDELQLLRARHALAVAESLLNDPLTPTTSDTISRLKTDLWRRELDVFTRRSRRRPEQIGLQIAVADRLKRLGNFSAAVQTLEPLQEHPTARAEVCLELGECRQLLRQFDPALALYAASMQHSPPDSDTHRRAQARGVRLAEAMGRQDLLPFRRTP